MPIQDVGAVVPVKRLGYALGRLSRVLDRGERRVLQSAMLGDVLAALAGRSWWSPQIPGPARWPRAWVHAQWLITTRPRA